MPVYCNKLLELKSVQEVSNKFYLQIRLSFGEELDLYLEIDDFTANNINIAIKGDEKYKYRLSFNNSFDIIKEQYVAIVARTFLENSHRITFYCSKEFVDILDSIKNTQDISELDKLPFISRSLEPTINEQEIKIITQDEVKEEKQIKLVPMSLFSLIAIFLVLLVSIAAISLDKANITEKVLAESIEANTDIIVIKKDVSYSEDNIIFEDFSSIEPIIPYLVLEETMTYSLPKGYVALTFDDGPSQYTKEIVDVLKEHDAGGTFFFIAQGIGNYIDQVNYVKSNGFSIGSHSLNHINIPTLPLKNQEIELVQSIELLNEVTNSHITFFRPPYGAYSEDLKDLIIEHDYRMVLWNNDPEDWKTSNPDSILKNIQVTDASGAIILLHESQSVIDALPMIINYLQELGLKIVNLK